MPFLTVEMDGAGRKMHLTMHVQTGGGAFRFTHVWAGHLVTSFREKEKDYVFTPEHILRRSVPKLPQESV